MTQKTRRILYLSFILLFLIIAPILLLYASGYRYNWSRHKIIKTCLISIKSQPEGATVYLDGRQLDKKTPTTLSNLLPANYQLRLAKDGYLSWQHDFSLNPGQAWIAPEIVLLRQTDSQLVIDQKVISVKKPERGNYLLTVVQNESGFKLVKIDLKDNTLTELLTATDPIQLESQVLDEQIIVSYLNEGLRRYKKINITDPRLSTDLTSLPQNVQLIDWVNANQLAVLIDTTLCQISLIDFSRICDSDSVSRFQISQNKIYWFENQATTTNLYQAELNDLFTKKLIAPLPFLAQPRLIADQATKLIIFDELSYDLYEINTTGQFQLTQKPRAAKAAFWLNSDQLIYYSDFEIWLVNRKVNDSTLISRLSDPIQQVSQLPGSDYLLVAQIKNIQAVELEGIMGQRNFYPLIDQPVNWLALDSTGNNLFFRQTDTQQLWKKPLR